MVEAGFKKGKKLERWEAATQNPTAALKAIGALIVSASQRSFKTQKLGRDKWAPRAVPNIYGIIADFHKGTKNPPSRRFEPRLALRDTGRLAASIADKIQGRTVTVGSNLPYASVHQTGGPIESLPVTQQVRDLLAAFLKGSGKQWRKNLGFLFQLAPGEKLKGEVEARPFVGLTKEVVEDVAETIGVKIFEVR